VRSAAAAKFSSPLNGNDLRIRITFFYNTLPDFDTDNVSKPICDALNGVAYIDDHQLGARLAYRKNINGSYHIEGANPDLAGAIAEGEDFVYIEVDQTDATEAGTL